MFLDEAMVMRGMEETMVDQRQKPSDRVEKLGAEIGEARRRLEDHKAHDWTGGLGALLEDLSHDLHGVHEDGAPDEPDTHARLDEIEARLSEARSRIASAEKLKT
ncbi:hypothetical protein [Rhodobacteraceae bacterium DSL-40]|uniref:hypothetical protein n=1 Tax=Amaricoccus sp. B4 TaxID=3368557 RepID=UPI0013A6C817